jgi:hypothetical protein
VDVTDAYRDDVDAMEPIPHFTGDELVALEPGDVLWLIWLREAWATAREDDLRGREEFADDDGYRELDDAAGTLGDGRVALNDTHWPVLDKDAEAVVEGV